MLILLAGRELTIGLIGGVLLLIILAAAVFFILRSKDKKKAMAFIESIKDMSFSTVTTDDIISDAHIYCDDCGGECEVGMNGKNNKYVEADQLEELKDKAWRILADLSE